MRTKKLLLLVTVFCLALELLLQLGALFVSLTYQPPSVASRADVVCVGDSYTAGIGATSPEQSYPAQLQRRLLALGHGAVGVANGGLPGQDSAAMLRRLPGLLRPETKAVCALMAFNDTWSRPARVDAKELVVDTSTPGAFQWRWRTARLVALCIGFAANSWHRTSNEVAVAPPPPDLLASKPEDLLDLDAGFRGLDELGLTVPNEPPPVLAPLPAAEVQTQLTGIEQRIASGAAREALTLVEAILAATPDCAPAQKLLAVALHAAGDAERARTTLEALAKRAEGNDGAAREAHIIALLATGHAEQAIVAARAYTALEPRSLVAWVVLQDASFALGRTEEFRQIVPTTLRVLGRLMPPLSAAMARHYAETTRETAPARAARLMVAAALLDGNVGLSRAKVATVRPNVPWSDFVAALDGVATAKAEVVQRWRALLQAAYLDDGNPAAWAQTLEHHLLEVGRICAERGIRLVVLGYPFPHPGLEDVQRRTAARLGAPYLALRERFDQELTTRPREELFVQNGHCSDAGYAIVAEMAAAALDPLLRQ